MKPILGIDLGTTQIKFALLNDDGTIRKLTRVNTPFRENGYDPGEIRSILYTQTENLLAEEPQPLGIVITGMAEAGLILDADGNPCTPILPWFDGGPKKTAGTVTAEEDRRFFAVTGLHCSFKYGVFKYLYLKEKYKLQGRTSWISICDYAAYVLTGTVATVPGFAARTYLYDIVQGCWNQELLERFGLTQDQLPNVVPGGQVIGYYKGTIPVTIAGHDHICAAYGLLKQHPEAVCDSAGTSETYISKINSGNDTVTDRTPDAMQLDASSGFLYGPYADRGLFAMLNVPSSGQSVEWFRRKLQKDELDYAEIVSMKMPEGPTGILYFPFLTGSGSPWYDQDVCAAFIGLRECHSTGNVLKSVYEGIQYQAAMQIRPAAIICAGGSTRNEQMMRIKADIFNCRVIVPVVEEATLTGAAALFIATSEGAAAAGAFLEKPMKIGKIYEPETEYAAEYARILEEKYIPFTQKYFRRTRY